MEAVHIFGVNHYLQRVDSMSWTAAGRADEEHQKANFRSVLNEIITENRIDLIAEEEKPGVRNIGAAIAEERRLAYVELTMPAAERERLGIDTRIYERRPETQARAYREFERRFFEQIASRNARVTLAICGRRHMRGLEERIRNAGARTFVYDVCNYDWWRGIPLEDGINVIGYEHRGDEG